MTKTEHAALYRKYRPETFAEVRGQDQVVKVLEASLKQGKIFHAYLFAGSRGTGKTSVARILAQAVGCKPTDLYEIDAASNRGIDDIREIKAAVDTLPFESPYKVYIIDEVHMLTKEAFNALLKTLEEPPKHVIFILATTEVEKLPETIVSRCQVFQFSKPTIAILNSLVLDTAKKEGYTLDQSAAELIALLGDGSFRDTHGILQKIISFSKDKKVTADEVELATGAPSGEVVNAFLKAVDSGDVSGALGAIAKASDANLDMRAFAKLILRKIRAVMHIRLAPIHEKELATQFSERDFAVLKEIAKSPKAGITSKTLAEFLVAYQEIGKHYISSISLELAVMRLLEKAPEKK